MQEFIEYDGDVFKTIAVVPKYRHYENVFVAKEPHYTPDGRSYQVINADYRHQGETRPIKSVNDGYGYLMISLPRNGKKHLNALVHRLVFLAWADDLPDNYQELQINHLDENRKNNCLINLELVTAMKNNNYGGRNQRAANSLVKSGHTAAVVAINITTRQEYRYGTQGECARHLGLQGPSIAHCLAGRNHKHKGYVFCHQDEYTPALVDQLITAATRRNQTI